MSYINHKIAAFNLNETHDWYAQLAELKQRFPVLSDAKWVLEKTAPGHWNDWHIETHSFTWFREAAEHIPVSIKMIVVESIKEMYGQVPYISPGTVEIAGSYVQVPNPKESTWPIKYSSTEELVKAFQQHPEACIRLVLTVYRIDPSSDNADRGKP